MALDGRGLATAKLPARGRKILGCALLLGAAGILLLLSAGAARADSCPNAEFRTGHSAQLPNCRAYELATPPDLGSRLPSTDVLGNRNFFATRLAMPDGDSMAFLSIGGALPGLPGNGVADFYRSDRTAAGWSTSLVGPTAAEAESSSPGGVTSNFDYVTFTVSGTGDHAGSLVIDGSGDYLLKPDGSFELIGLGSLGQDPNANAELVTPDADHIVFSADVPLEPGAPVPGDFAVYDRALGGPTHLVSILPGEVPTAQLSRFVGASSDGSVILFQFPFGETQLFARVDNQRTVEVAPAESTFAGATAGGETVFYLLGGNLFAYDVASGTTDQVTAPGDVQMVMITPNGSLAYFTSEAQIGGEGTAGLPNLYVWKAAGDSTTLLGTLEPSDLTRKPGLGRWVSENLSLEPGSFAGPGNNASRTTPDGRYLVFESAAQLTAADNDGHVAIYRYDSVEESLLCVSCRPDGGPSAGDARLEDIGDFMRPGVVVDNVTADGSSVFFETSEALVPRDSAGTNDVYEWSAGEGGQGTVSLISSGTSPEPTPGIFGEVLVEPNMLWAVTPDGGDVFFVTHDALVPLAGSGGSRSIYTAKVGGGLASQQVKPKAACVGDGCQGAATPPPAPPVPGSSAFAGRGNAKPKARSPRRKCGRRANGKKANEGKRRGCKRHGGNDRRAGK